MSFCCKCYTSPMQLYRSSRLGTINSQVCRSILELAPKSQDWIWPRRTYLQLYIRLVRPTPGLLLPQGRGRASRAVRDERGFNVGLPRRRKLHSTYLCTSMPLFLLCCFFRWFFLFLSELCSSPPQADGWASSMPEFRLADTKFILPTGDTR